MDILNESVYEPVSKHYHYHKHPILMEDGALVHHRNAPDFWMEELGLQYIAQLARELS